MNKQQYQDQVTAYLKELPAGEHHVPKEILPSEKAKPFFRELVMDFQNKNRNPYFINLIGRRKGERV